MHTLRVRPFMYFAMGIAVTAVAAWSLSAWRASAAVSADESTFVNVSPTRILDTRSDLGLTGPFVSAVPQDLQVTGSVPVAPVGNAVVVPLDATGVILNVTVVSPTADGFVSIRPADAAGPPTTSSLNFRAGDIIPNSVTVQMPTAGADMGKIEITYDAFGNAGPTTEMLIDVVGYTKNSGLASLQAEVNTLQTQVADLTAAGASVVFDGDAAGGSLTGTYPSPGLAANSVGASQIAANAVGTSEIAAGSVGIAKLGAVIVDNAAIPLGSINVATGTCDPVVVDIDADGATIGAETLALASLLLGSPAQTEWAVEGLPVVQNDVARVRMCNFSGVLADAPAARVSIIVLQP